MAEGERRFFPTTAKLEELREEGIVPYVPSTAALGACTGAIAAFVFGWGYFEELYAGIVRSIQAGSLDGLTQTVQQKGGGVFFLVPAVVVMAIFTSGLLQTRFWISLSRVSPSIDRLWQGHRMSLGALFSRLFTSAAALLIAVFLSAFLLWMYGPDVLRLLNTDQHLIFSWLKSLGKSLGIAFGVVVVVFSFASIVLGRLLFLYRNRMTKEELEAELRSER